MSVLSKLLLFQICQYFSNFNRFFYSQVAACKKIGNERDKTKNIPTVRYCLKDHKNLYRTVQNYCPVMSHGEKFFFFQNL